MAGHVRDLLEPTLRLGNHARRALNSGLEDNSADGAFLLFADLQNALDLLDALEMALTVVSRIRPLR
jgi:hypothetical protein